MAVRARNAHDRITQLEEKRVNIEERLTAIETKLDEVYKLLLQGKAILWAVTKIGGLLTVSAIVVSAAIAVARYFGE